jgi:hypothetical protein
MCVSSLNVLPPSPSSPRNFYFVSYSDRKTVKLTKKSLLALWLLLFLVIQTLSLALAILTLFPLILRGKIDRRTVVFLIFSLFSFNLNPNVFVVQQEQQSRRKHDDDYSFKSLSLSLSFSLFGIQITKTQRTEREIESTVYDLIPFWVVKLVRSLLPSSVAIRV